VALLAKPANDFGSALLRPLAAADAA
jgi:hypothetical protein